MVLIISTSLRGPSFSCTAWILRSLGEDLKTAVPYFQLETLLWGVNPNLRGHALIKLTDCTIRYYAIEGGGQSENISWKVKYGNSVSEGSRFVRSLQQSKTSEQLQKIEGCSHFLSSLLRKNVGTWKLVRPFEGKKHVAG